MGAFDYENAQINKVGGKSQLDFLNEHLNYNVKYSFCVTHAETYTAYVLNRPVFYYTKLREEIFFIDVKLINTIGIKNYIFAVNERSFFRRFNVIDKDGIRLSYEDYPSLRNLLINIIRNPNDYKINLNIFGFEQELLEQCSADYTEEEYLNFLNDGTSVRINSFINRNKRLWLFLFNNVKIEYPRKSDLGDPNYTVSDEAYKISSRERYDSEVGGHFDVEEAESRRKYQIFIN